MALSAKVGRFNVTTGAATATIPVVGVGFQPTCVLFWWSGRTSIVAGIARATHNRGFGWATSTTNRYCVGSRSGDATATGQAVSGFRDDACIASIATGASSFDGMADLQSFDSDGFTIIIDDQFPTDFAVSFLALGGTSLTNSFAGTFAPTGSAPVTQAVTGVGFQPDCVLFIASGPSATVNGVANDSIFMLGAMNGSGGEAVYCGGSNAASATMTTKSYCRRDECIARLSATIGASMSDRAEFSAFGVDGFTINWLERAQTGTILYLALQGASSVVGDLLTQTDTTTPIAESSFGFEPTAALFVSACTSADAADTPHVNDELSIGAASGTANRNATAILDEDNVPDSEVTTAFDQSQVYANISTASAIEGLMDLQSFDADGLTTIMDDADPSQAFVWYLALGPAAAAGSKAPPPRFSSMRFFKRRF